MNENGEHWHLDKRVPLALILTIFLQTATVVWWASGVNARVAQLEAKAVRADAATNDIAALKVRLDNLDQATKRIEDKVDRLIERSGR